MAVDDRTTAIVGARGIDGLGRDPIEKGTVVIEGDGIAAVGKDTAVQVPRGARVIDAAGRTVLPGIIDCHVHSTYRARDIRKHLTNTPTYNVLRSTHILEETLACGVTTARDMGGADAGFREAIAEGFIKGPALDLDRHDLADWRSRRFLGARRPPAPTTARRAPARGA